MSGFHLNSLRLSNFKSHADTHLRPGRLAVFVGANGTGKSSIFSFLDFLSGSLKHDVPPKILSQKHINDLFHGDTSHFTWDVICAADGNDSLRYAGRLEGPIGRPNISIEDISASAADTREDEETLLHWTLDNGYVATAGHPGTQPITKKPNQAALFFVTPSQNPRLFDLKQYILGWSFFSGLSIADEAIREYALVEQSPSLARDGSNLSAVLHYYMTEHPKVFSEIQFHLKHLIPGFSHLTVKGYGGPGGIMAFWHEEGINKSLSLADLSDGILRLLCWMALFLHPKPPTLICIDEPDLGVHPRTLPLLAGLIKKASVRTQIFVATHNSYFLSQFDLENITVFRKAKGTTTVRNPKDSKTIVELLEDFGQGDIASMHITEELEVL